ncbi:S-adenosyl-L-methionine-dependent methyltransferase [Apodospora peruviana]|uniref:S-adenosyl-L-methionine-dependent methyltransferase n=1 Tax=Apodospora peruviana TaxID=516989 RepID=A0AAE0M1G2_9PEZI|nr:S-adenosyl-L-methionine-dependent methyltransferase [Apodospora peruviana]
MSDKAKSKSPSASPPPAAESSEGAGILPPQYWTTHAAEAGHNAEDYADADSTLGSEAATSTASITSSVLDYRELYGRTYHSERGNAQYWGTNDERQSEALDILHHCLMICMEGKIHFAPIKKDIQKALDLGCGTGIWAIDFADEFTGAEVIGTDISPIQPSWVPPNVKFEIEDMTAEWTFGENTFDYIHGRWLSGSIADWNELFKSAFRALKPGGYLESFEPSALMESDDGSVKDTDAMGQWGKLFIEGAKKIGRPFTVVDDELQRKAMEAAGFVDIQEVNIKTPIGLWPKDKHQKEVGQYAQLVIESDAEGHILFMANTLGWSREQILVFIAQLRREMRSQKHHAYYRQKIIWGRKPE